MKPGGDGGDGDGGRPAHNLGRRADLATRLSALRERSLRTRAGPRGAALSRVPFYVAFSATIFIGRPIITLYRIQYYRVADVVITRRTLPTRVRQHLAGSNKMHNLGRRGWRLRGLAALCDDAATGARKWWHVHPWRRCTLFPGSPQLTSLHPVGNPVGKGNGQQYWALSAIPCLYTVTT